MRLLLIRHADAGERDPIRWPDDSLRPITDKGRKTQVMVTRILRKKDWLPDRIFSSPWTRAWETAEIVAEALNDDDAHPIPCLALARQPDLGELAKAIGRVGPGQTVGLVGHDPWIGELGSLLLVGKAQGLKIDFPKSGMLGLETKTLEPGGATLWFCLRPKMLA